MKRLWPGIFLAFVGSGFVMPSLPAWAFLFYSIVIPALIIRLFSGVMLPLRDVLGAGLFIVWGVLSITWSPSWHGLGDALCTMLFALGGVVALGERPDFASSLKRVCIAGMSINAVIELGLLLSGIDGRVRPGGVGVFYTTLPAVITAGIAFLWAASSFLKSKKAPAESIGALLVLPSFMFLSGSRGPCFVCACVALMVACRASYARLWRFAALVLGGLAVSCVCMWSRVVQFTQDAVTRGDSFHRLIWRTVWHDSWQAPFIGHGQGAPVQVHADGHVFAHAHNLYLGSFYAYGLVGVFLLLSAYAWPMIVRLWHREWADLAVPCFIALAVMTDIATPLKGPAEIWYILWVPWLCLIGTRPSFSARPAAYRL